MQFLPTQVLETSSQTSFDPHEPVFVDVHATHSAVGSAIELPTITGVDDKHSQIFDTHSAPLAQSLLLKHSLHKSQQIEQHYKVMENKTKVLQKKKLTKRNIYI